jgi:hypothetical protein
VEQNAISFHNRSANRLAMSSASWNIVNGAWNFAHALRDE